MKTGGEGRPTARGEGLEINEFLRERESRYVLWWYLLLHFFCERNYFIFLTLCHIIIFKFSFISCVMTTCIFGLVAYF